MRLRRVRRGGRQGGLQPGAPPGEYCALLKSQLRPAPGDLLGDTEDPSEACGPGRRRDPVATFLSFPVQTGDGRFHDGATKEQCRIALIRGGQTWEQAQGREQTQRGKLRQKLAELLAGDGYAGLDAAVKDRLLEDIRHWPSRRRGSGRSGRVSGRAVTGGAPGPIGA